MGGNIGELSKRDFTAEEVEELNDANICSDDILGVCNKFDSLSKNYVLERGASDREIKDLEGSDGLVDYGSFMGAEWFETNDYTAGNYPEYGLEDAYPLEVRFESYELEKEILTLESLENSIRLGEENLKEAGEILNTLYSIDQGDGKKNVKIKLYENIDLLDAISIYEQIIFSTSLSLTATNLGISDWRSGKSTKYNNEATRNFLASQREGGIIEEKSLGAIYGFMGELRHLDEDTPSDRMILKKILGFDPKETPWCAGIVKVALRKNGFSDAAKRMDLTAASALGMSIAGAHIGISDGLGNFISGNTSLEKKGKRHDGVELKPINHSQMYGWILPEDAGLIDRVCWASEGISPPPGALVLVQQGSKVVNSIRNKAGRWPN